MCTPDTRRARTQTPNFKQISKADNTDTGKYHPDIRSQNLYTRKKRIYAGWGSKERELKLVYPDFVDDIQG